MITEREAAKYPFLREAVKLVEVLDLTLEDLTAPNMERALNRAEERVAQAIQSGQTSANLADCMSELLSFPIANILVASLGDPFLFRRYSLAEAVRVHEILNGENEERIAKIAREEFDWDLRLVREILDGRLYSMELHFTDYLSNASAFREDKWKLVNKLMRNGYVLISRSDATRLIQEEVQRIIVDLFAQPTRMQLPEPLQDRAERLTKLYDENRERLTGGELPRTLVMAALPPCIRRAYEGLLAGRRASHMERFALTSFLVNAGMDVDEIVKLFVSVTDFDEQFTRYQVEHIAGLRGSRTRYTPPTCSTLRTHGVCHNPDRICQGVKHPLSYYRRKLRALKRENHGASDADQDTRDDDIADLR